MVTILEAKTNSDGSITLRAVYISPRPDVDEGKIYKYFIAKHPLSVNPDQINHADILNIAYYKQLDSTVLELDVIIPDSEIMANTLEEVLFIYVVTNESELKLCQCKDKYDMTSVIPLCKIYKNLMGFVNSLNHDECNIPMNFIDYIMRYAYLMSALKSGNHYKVQEIWDTYFKNNANVNVSNGNCGCHG